MNFIINKTYSELSDYNFIIQTEGDALDVMANCGEPRAILIHYKNLSSDFFDLSTGLAGAIMQKFANYSMKCALIIDPEKIKSQRFHELIYEHQRSTFFRFFENYDDAVLWLERDI